MRHELGTDLLVSFDKRSERAVPIVYDLIANTVDQNLTQYGLYLLREKYRDSKTVEGVLYQLARFCGYLRKRRVRPSAISTSILKAFREALFEELRRKARQGKERIAKVTVNAALDAIYPWLRWLQETGRVPAGLIGPFPAAVLSEQITSKTGRTTWTAPLRYPGTGKASKHKMPGFVPSEDARLSVLEFFHETASSNFLAERNALFQRIVESTGLRRGSVCSLHVEQFSRQLLDAVETAYVDVCPAQQKNGYEDVFHFELPLAYEVCGFVEGVRAELVARKGWTESTTDGAVFISERTGRRIAERSMTRIFSAAMRAAGAPVGSAIHSWRHKYTQDEIDRETAYRASEGLDTSVASIGAAVSLRLGHKNPNSIHTYVASRQSRVKKAPGAACGVSR